MSDQLTMGVIGQSYKANEHRAPIEPSHIAEIPPELRARIYFQAGYGERFGVSDATIAAQCGVVLATDDLYARCDIILLPKPTQADFPRWRDGQGGSRPKWLHAAYPLVWRRLGRPIMHTMTTAFSGSTLLRSPSADSSRAVPPSMEYSMPKSCPRCYGKGVALSVPVNRIVVEPRRSIKDGAICRWPRWSGVPVREIYLERLLGELAREIPFDLNEPWESLDEEIRRSILYGVHGRNLKLITYFDPDGDPQAREFEGIVTLFDDHYDVKKALGTMQQCPVCEGKPYEILYPRERIEAIVEEHAAGKVSALALTSLGIAIKIVEQLAREGVPFRAVPELLPVDEGALNEDDGKYRRWVLFVREADLPRVTGWMERKSGVVRDHGHPVLFVLGALCREPSHDFELLPCSWCDTGHNWIAKANQLERAPAPKLPPNTL